MYNWPLSACVFLIFRAALRNGLFSWCFPALWVTHTLCIPPWPPLQFYTVYMRQETAKEWFNVPFKRSKILSNIQLQRFLNQKHDRINTPTSFHELQEFSEMIFCQLRFYTELLILPSFTVSWNQHHKWQVWYCPPVENWNNYIYQSKYLKYRNPKNFYENSLLDMKPITRNENVPGCLFND